MEMAENTYLCMYKRLYGSGVRLTIIFLFPLGSWGFYSYFGASTFSHFLSFIDSKMAITRFTYIVALSWAIEALALPQYDLIHSVGIQLTPRALPVGTCNPDTPCENGACCGSNNLCGYSPTECGTGCMSNCNAKAQCGQYGTPGQQSCPLNVCCSKFGSASLLRSRFVRLITLPADSAEALLTSVILVVRRALVDVDLLLNPFAATSESVSAQLGKHGRV